MLSLVASDNTVTISSISATNGAVSYVQSAQYRSVGGDVSELELLLSRVPVIYLLMLVILQLPPLVQSLCMLIVIPMVLAILSSVQPILPEMKRFVLVRNSSLRGEHLSLKDSFSGGKTMVVRLM